MPHTLIAYSANIDSAVPIAVAALADQHVRVQANDVIVPEAMNVLIGAFAFGLNITRAQLVSPSLRRLVNHEISPINIGALPLSPLAFNDNSMDPLVLDPSEALNLFAAESGAGATRVNCGVWLSDGETTPINGEVIAVRFTGTTTLVANSWTNAAITFDQSLPAGRYQVVGMRAESAGLQLARLVFVGGIWRPGCIGFANAGQVEPNIFRDGGLGAWGEFAHNTPPTIDYLSNSADTAQAGVLDLIKLA